MTSNSHPSNGIWGTEESVFVLDRDLRYTAFNSAHAEHMRALYGAEITLGGRLGDYQSVAVDRETAEGNLMRALAGERVVASAFSGEPGSERYIDVVHEPVTDETGQVVGVEVRAFDATERQSIETALREREERYRHLFEGAIDGIYELSLEGRVLAANKAFATMLGYLTGADMTAESADTACPLWADPEDWARFIGMLAEQGILRAYEC